MGMRLSRLTMIAALIGALLASPLLAAQRQPVPRPFPRPGERAPATPPEPSPPVDVVEQTAPADPAVPSASGESPPTEAQLGVPIYPAAQFITSYDATRGQRYYLFGTSSTFNEMVSYYATVLRTRGNRVFDEPPTHMFDVGRFRQESMAFPPGVTIKDYTWNGAEGYLNPQRGAQPDRFATIIQIVPAPPGAER